MIRNLFVRLYLLALACCLGQAAWAIPDGVYTIASKHSGKLVEVGSADTADGANVIQWPSNGHATQQWRITNLGGNEHSIINVNSGKAMEVYDFSTVDGGNVAQWTYWGGDSQIWIITDQGNGFHGITNKLSGKSLDLLDWDTADGANIGQWTWWGGDTQLWALNRISNPNPNPGGVFRPKYILGADITWTLEQESIGRTYRDEGRTKSIERILVDHGFNFVRLRTFVCPQCSGGYLDNLYSGAGPTENWADTAHTIEMAQRVKACGMGVFLDFHLSDNWASIGHQDRPSQWNGMSLSQMRTASYNYSKGVLDQMVAAGVKPDMVQCGNENDNRVAGYSLNDWAGFSGIMNSCIQAVRDTDRNIKVVIQHGRPRPDGNFPNWLSRVSGNNPPIDADVVCGSTYGTTNNGQDWRDMFGLVINNWGKPVMSCEYTDQRRDLVNSVIRGMPNGMGWGTFIWEPTAYGDRRPFDFSNNAYTANASMDQYARIAREAGLPVPSRSASQLQGTSCQ